MRRISWSFLLVFTLAVPSMGTPAGLLEPTMLPPLRGDAESLGHDLDDRRLVVGVSIGSVWTAIVWSRHRRQTMLVPLPGHANSTAIAINNNGLVLGASFGESGSCGDAGALGVIWKVRRTRSTGLETPDAEDARLPEIVAVHTTLRPMRRDVTTQATGINEDGVAVGVSISRPRANCRARITAVKWDPDGNPTELPPLRRKTYAWPQAINDHGDVVGASASRSNVPIDWVATLWSLSGRAGILKSPIRNWTSFAQDINNRRRVVGVVAQGFSNQFAVVWDVDGNAKVLPPLAGDTRSWAGAINNRGAVIGRSDSFLGRSSVIWRRGVPSKLPAPAGHTNTAVSEINDRGNVVGAAWNGSGWSAVVWR